MVLWRIEYSRHVDGILSGTGPRRHGGRWNRKGTAAVYLSSHLSLASFEKFVHAQPAGRHVALYAISTEIPDDLIRRAERPLPLPRGWRSAEPDRETMEWGSQWIASKSSLAAVVPSALLPLDCFEHSAEFNLILNPDHPDIRRARVLDRIPHSFDPRMWKPH